MRKGNCVPPTSNYKLRSQQPDCKVPENIKVFQIGSAVKSVKPGDQVISSYEVAENWADYGIFNQNDIIHVDNDLPIEHSAFLKVNPPSAYVMLTDFAKLKKGDWIVQNCGNSAIGKQIIQVWNSEKYTFN